MPKTKIAVTMDAQLVRRLDRLVRERRARNRSNAIETAVRGMLDATNRAQLAREAALLDPDEERAFAEEGIGGSGPWPEPY